MFLTQFFRTDSLDTSRILEIDIEDLIVFSPNHQVAYVKRLGIFYDIKQIHQLIRTADLEII